MICKQNLLEVCTGTKLLFPLKKQQQQSAAQQTNLSGVLLQGNYLFYPFRRGSGIGFQRDIVNQTTQKLIRPY